MQLVRRTTRILIVMLFVTFTGMYPNFQTESALAAGDQTFWTIPGYYNLGLEIYSSELYEADLISSKKSNQKILIVKPNPGPGIKYSGIELNSHLQVVRKLEIPSRQLALAYDSKGNIFGTGGQCNNRGLGIDSCSSIIDVTTGKQIINLNNSDAIDVHELLIDKDSNYWFISYPKITDQDTLMNFRKIPGYENRPIVDCQINKISPEGVLLYTWSASSNLPITEVVKSHLKEFDGTPVQIQAYQGYLDPFHCNSIGFIDEDNILVSMRNTNSIYSVSLKKKVVNWKIGGNYWRGTSLNVRGISGSPKGVMNSQHDAQSLGGNYFTYFDNQSMGDKPARGVLFKIDTNTSGSRFARVLHIFENPDKKNSTCQGSFRRLRNDNYVAAWGCALNGVTLFSPTGIPIAGLRILTDKSNHSYFPENFSRFEKDSLLQRLTTLMTYRAITD
jgi:hypothetical protein